MKNNSFRMVLLILTAALALLVAPVQAQQAEELRLNVQRSFGFSSGSQIRGTFALSVVTNLSITSVKYYIDGQLIAEVTQSPFTLSFNTSTYSVGWHDLTAEARASDNRIVKSPVRRFEFVSAEVESQAVSGILIPLLSVIALVTIIGGALQVFWFKKKGMTQLPLGAKRSYGIFGGTICPKCKRPFPRHIFGLNLGVGRLDRCDYCGKWSITTRRSDQELAQAEADELKMVQSTPVAFEKQQKNTEQERVDDSKYTDL